VASTIFRLKEKTFNQVSNLQSNVLLPESSATLYFSDEHDLAIFSQLTKDN
jgi:hypothetical protein